MKSKTVAGLLAIFVGGIGIHKFYLGKYFQGFLYIILCWTYIPSIIAVIEGIRYLIMSEDAFIDKYCHGNNENPNGSGVSYSETLSSGNNQSTVGSSLRNIKK